MGRIRTGWTLAKQSWAVLEADRSLAIFPLISLGATIVAFLLLIAPGVVIVAASNADWTIVPFALLAAYAATFIAIYFNVALAGAATLSLDGRDTTLQDGLSVARERRGVIAKWALVQTVVGLLLNVAENAFGDSGPGRIVGAIVRGILGAAWTIATFFVIPVLALEGLQPREAFTRSVSLTKERWGEGVVGNAAIGLAVFVVAAIPIATLVIVGSALAGSAPAVGILFFGVAAVVAIAAGVIGSALGIIFRVALYRFTTTGQAVGTFDASAMNAAFRPR